MAWLAQLDGVPGSVGSAKGNVPAIKRLRATKQQLPNPTKSIEMAWLAQLDGFPGSLGKAKGNVPATKRFRATKRQLRNATKSTEMAWLLGGFDGWQALRQFVFFLTWRS